MAAPPTTDSLAEDLKEIKTYLLTQDTLCEATIKSFLVRYDVPGQASLIRASSPLFRDSALLEALLDNWEGLLEPTTFVKFVFAFCLIEDKSVTYSLFLESAGSTEVLRAMDTNVKSKELVYFGARSLVVLSHNQELRLSLSEGDGISLVVDCLHCHKRDASTCMVLLVVLTNLLYRNPDSRKAFVASNGIPITLSVISANHSHSSLLLAAFHVIRHATNDKNVRIAESKARTHIFGDIISALQQHTQNEPLIVHGLWIFLNLMNSNHENKTKFLTEHGLALLDTIARDQERNDLIVTLVSTVFQQMLKLQRLRTEILAKGSKTLLFNVLANFTEPKPLIATYKALYSFALHSTARQQIGMAIAEKLLFHMRSPKLSSQFYAVIGKLFLRLCLDSSVKARFVELHALETVRLAKEHTLDFPSAIRFYLAAEVFLLSSDATIPPRLDIAEVLLLQHVGKSADDDSDSSSSSSSSSSSEDGISDGEDEDASVVIAGPALALSQDSPRSLDSSSNASSPGRHSIASDSEEGTPRGTSLDQDNAQITDSTPKDIVQHLDEVIDEFAPQLLGVSSIKLSTSPISSPHKIVGISRMEVPDSPRSSSNGSTSDSIPSITIDEPESSELDATTSNASNVALEDPEMEALLKDIDDISSPVPSPRKTSVSATTSLSGSATLASPGTKHRRQASRGSQNSGGSIGESFQELDAELDRLRKDDFGMSSLDKFDLDLSLDLDESELMNAVDALNASTNSAGNDPDAVLARIEAIMHDADQLSISFPPDASELDKAILQLETDLSPSSPKAKAINTATRTDPEQPLESPNGTYSLPKSDSTELMEAISALETGLTFTSPSKDKDEEKPAETAVRSISDDPPAEIAYIASDAPNDVIQSEDDVLATEEKPAEAAVRSISVDPPTEIAYIASDAPNDVIQSEDDVIATEVLTDVVDTTAVETEPSPNQTEPISVEEATISVVDAADSDEEHDDISPSKVSSDSDAEEDPEVTNGTYLAPTVETPLPAAVSASVPASNSSSPPANNHADHRRPEKDHVPPLIAKQIEKQAAGSKTPFLVLGAALVLLVAIIANYNL